mmetsp:Transcript_12422/g.19141  ORF Transcript_12422/g.19141 Transcript_12422/m.19141 type:complete len:202 (+) Transcript_12422:61-666(+)
MAGHTGQHTPCLSPQNSAQTTVYKEKRCPGGDPSSPHTKTHASGGKQTPLAWVCWDHHPSRALARHFERCSGFASWYGCALALCPRPHGPSRGMNTDTVCHAHSTCLAWLSFMDGVRCLLRRRHFGARSCLAPSQALLRPLWLPGRHATSQLPRKSTHCRAGVPRKTHKGLQTVKLDPPSKQNSNEEARPMARSGAAGVIR